MKTATSQSNQPSNTKIQVFKSDKTLCLNNVNIIARASDGYINTTCICRAGNKLLNDWNRLEKSKAFLQFLSSSTGIPVNELLKYESGSNNERGTWGHPQVAINVAQWVSLEFDVKVSKWILDIKKNDKLKEIISPLKPNEIKEYKLRLKDNIEFLLPIRRDGMVNATLLCKAGNKRLDNYKNNKETQSYLEALVSITGIPVNELLNTNIGGNHSGTWVHRKVAYHLAQWISPSFAVQVSNWLDELFITGKVELGNELCTQELEEKYQEKIKNLENSLELKDKEIKKITQNHEQYLKRKRRNPYDVGNVVYVVSNKAFTCYFKTDYYKIGEASQKSEEDDSAFMRRLSTYNTGSPINFDVEGLFYIKENKIVEQLIKDKFNKNMNPSNKEWIKDVNILIIKQFIRDICNMLEYEYKEIDCLSIIDSSKVSEFFEDEDHNPEIQNVISQDPNEDNNSESQSKSHDECDEKIHDECDEKSDEESNDESDEESNDECDECDEKSDSEPLYDMENIKMYSTMTKEQLYNKFTSKQLQPILKGFNLVAGGLKDAQLTRLITFCKEELKSPTMKKIEIKEKETFELFYTYTTPQGFKFYQRKSDLYIGLSTLSISIKKPVANWLRNKTLQKERDEYLKTHNEVSPFTPSLGGTSNEKSWADKYFVSNYIKWVNMDGLEKEFNKFINRGDVWDLPTCKKCACCKDIKEYTDYNKNKKMIDGYDRRCRSCYKKRYNKDDIQKSIALNSYHKRKATTDINTKPLKKPWK
jgi:hypothetical protein